MLMYVHVNINLSSLFVGWLFVVLW